MPIPGTELRRVSNKIESPDSPNPDAPSPILKREPEKIEDTNPPTPVLCFG